MFSYCKGDRLDAIRMETSSSKIRRNAKYKSISGETGEWSAPSDTLLYIEVLRLEIFQFDQ